MTKPGHTLNSTSIRGAGGAHIGFFGRPTILMNQENGQGGGGGGGQPKPGGEGGGAPALSDDARGEVAKLVNEAVSGAVTRHMANFKKQFSEDMGKTFAETLGPISQQLQALSESNQAPKGGRNVAPSEDRETKEAMTRYEGRIKELEQANAKEREAREQEKATRLREEERGSLATALRAAGLPDTTVKAAVALLHTEDKKVARTEDGRIVFRMEKGQGVSRYTDELDLDAGVGEWLKSDEGKSFMPARPAQGAGGQPVRLPGQPRNQSEAKQQATENLAKILLGGG